MVDLDWPSSTAKVVVIHSTQNCKGILKYGEFYAIHILAYETKRFLSQASRLLGARYNAATINFSDMSLFFARTFCGETHLKLSFITEEKMGLLSTFRGDISSVGN